MNRDKGFSLIELLVVVGILAILGTLVVLTLAPHRRMVKTEDAANALFTVMRQARILAVTRRQYYAVVINADVNNHVAGDIPLSNGSLPSGSEYLARSVSLIDMGRIAPGDERIVLVKQFPQGVNINNISELPAATNFPPTERTFTAPPLDSSLYSYVCYFDASGKAVNRADNTGNQEYRIFAFSAPDARMSSAPTLMRAVTLYGSTGGLKSWRYVTSPAGWVPQLKF